MSRSPRQRLFDRFAPIIGGLLVLPAIGVAGYRWIEGWPVLDALYMTVITLSTVGYTEVHPMSAAGRIFTMGLIVGGGVLAAYALTQVAQIVFSGELRRYWVGQKRRRMLAELSQHFIVCGYGRVGRNVVAELRNERLPFVVIEPQVEKVTAVQESGALAVQGDAAVEDVLRQAGIERARGLVACAKTDADNVFIVLTARSLRPDLTIVARADVEESEAKLRRAGASRVILPYHITGRRMVTMLVRPDVADFLDEVSHTSGLELVLEQIQIAATSPIVGLPLAEAQARHDFEVTVLACKHADGQWNTRPHSETVILPGSQMLALGTLPQLQKLLALAQR